MCLIAKVIRISRAKFHCNRLRAVQNIQDHASLSFWDSVKVKNDMCKNILGKPGKPVRSAINLFDRAALPTRKQNFPQVSAVGNVKVTV